MNCLDWLLDSDPAIRWQVMRDLLVVPTAEWQAERAKIATQGWGAELLRHEDPDGQWAGGAFLPAGFTRADWEAEGQPWTATSFVLTQLRELGLDPEAAGRAVVLIGENSRWDHAGQPFWEGEVEECINGLLVANGAYYGVDVSPVVERLTNERLDDGGWNCERAEGSTRSSFHTTINVLEGLLEFERATGGTAASIAARHTGEEYLLQRSLFRGLSTGEPIEALLTLRYPTRWRYDVLRGLDYFRSSSLQTGTPADPRLEAAVELLRAKRSPDGTWAQEDSLRGRVWVEVDSGQGEPSRWLTLRALRVLRWWES